MAIDVRLNTEPGHEVALASLASPGIGRAGRLRLDSAAVDAFAIMVLGGLLALVLWVWRLGTHSPGNGHEQLGLRASRRIVADREALEAEDLAQMLEAHNARRRRRGEPEVTVEDLELQVAQDVNAQQRRREVISAERERELGPDPGRGN
jgi:hypothetical protein